MADLTARQLRWLHSIVGDDVADSALQTQYDELGSVRDVAIWEVRRQKNLLLDSPLSTNVSGVASVNTTENVKALERELARLTTLDSDPSDDPVPAPEDGELVQRFEVIDLVRSRGR